MDHHYGIFEDALSNGPYFSDNDLSVVDIFTWMLSQWRTGGLA